MFKNGKFKSLLLVTLIVGIFISGCGSKDKNEAVAQVNGDKITLENYKQEYKIYRTLYESQLGEGVLDQEGPEGSTIDDMLREEIIDKLILETIIRQESEKEDIEISEEDLDENLENVIEYLGGKDQYSEFLIGSGFTNDYFKANLEKEMLFAEYEKNYLENLDIDKADGEEYFKEHKEELSLVEASHILVEDEEEAKEILTKLENGENFEELAASESVHEETKDSGGKLGYISKGGVLAGLPEVEEELFKLKSGEISGVVKSEMGYHILKVDDVKDTFESLEDEVMDLLKKKNFEDHIEALKESADIEIFQDKIDEIKADKKSKDKPKEEPKQDEVEEKEEEKDSKRK